MDTVRNLLIIVLIRYGQCDSGHTVNIVRFRDNANLPSSEQSLIGIWIFSDGTEATVASLWSKPMFEDRNCNQSKEIRSPNSNGTYFEPLIHSFAHFPPLIRTDRCHFWLQTSDKLLIPLPINWISPSNDKKSISVEVSSVFKNSHNKITIKIVGMSVCDIPSLSQLHQLRLAAENENRLEFAEKKCNVDDVMPQYKSIFKNYSVWALKLYKTRKWWHFWL